MTLSRTDLIYSVQLAVASLIAYCVAFYGLYSLVDRTSDQLGAMWAVISTVFVLRDTRAHSLTAALSRTVATLAAVFLCVLYFLALPFHAVGMAILIGLGVLLVNLAGRREDAITTGITIAVVMVVGGMNPGNDWLQAMLRLLDTLVGSAAGVAVAWAAKSLWGQKA